MAQLVHPGSINGNGNGTAATASTALEGTTRVGDSDGLSVEDTLNQLFAGVSPGGLLCDVLLSCAID